MHTNMNESGRQRFTFFKRGQRQIKISGYHAGHIQDEKPVVVAAGATVAGDIFAPEVTVAGLLLGSVVSRHTCVMATGQIWGDLHTMSLQIEPGGDVRGWVVKLDEPNYQALQAATALPQAPPEDQKTDLPPQSPQGTSMRWDDEHLDELRRLRDETARALAAQAEIEHAFDQRLEETVGDARGKVSSLENDLAEARRDLAEIREKAARSQAELDEVKAHSVQQGEELQAARQQLQDQQQAQSRQRLAWDELQEAKVAAESGWREAALEVKSVRERVENLEAALQSSLQHEAEQADALIHWQELAESAGAQCQGLQQQLKEKQVQIGHYEIELEELKRTCRELNEQLGQRRMELERLRKGYQQATSALRNREQPVAMQVAETNLLVEARHEIARLQSEMSYLRQEREEQAEQTLWQNANQKSTQIELETIRARVRQKQELARQLQVKVDQQTRFIEKQKRAAGKHIRELEAEIERLQRRLVGD